MFSFSLIFPFSLSVELLKYFDALLQNSSTAAGAVSSSLDVEDGDGSDADDDDSDDEDSDSDDDNSDKPNP
jgi:hypothetical protein